MVQSQNTLWIFWCTMNHLGLHALLRKPFQRSWLSVVRQRFNLKLQKPGTSRQKTSGWLPHCGFLNLAWRLSCSLEHLRALYEFLIAKHLFLKKKNYCKCNSLWLFFLFMFLVLCNFIATLFFQINDVVLRHLFPCWCEALWGHETCCINKTALPSIGTDR